MKGQAHLTIASEPLNWQLAPPAMYGECGAEVLQPMPVDSFTVAGGMLPEFDSLLTCGKCIARVAERRRYTDDPDDKGQDIPAAPFYVYAIANRLEVQAREHRGDTITNIESTVDKVQP
jgi:hypothetical protein